MSRNHETRLERLEKAPETAPKSIRDLADAPVEADGSTVPPTHYETSDGIHRWEREPNESAKDFERRVSDDAERITNHGAVALLPFNGRGL